MQKNKHTPGPWKRNHLTVKDHRGMVVAEVSAPHHMLKGRERNEDMEWSRGNARLIAAAPDMLTALETILAGGHLTTGEQAIVADAIAKATGRDVADVVKGA